MRKKIVLVSLLQLSDICFLKKKTNKLIFLKNNNLKKKLLKPNLPWTSEFGSPELLHPFPTIIIFACEFLQKGSLVLVRIQEP